MYPVVNNPFFEHCLVTLGALQTYKQTLRNKSKLQKCLLEVGVTLVEVEEEHLDMVEDKPEDVDVKRQHCLLVDQDHLMSFLWETCRSTLQKDF